MEKTQSASISIIDHFASVDDPRMERTRKHKLGDIIAVAICAVIAGADNWVDIETFGNAKIDWFKTFLELPNGIPSHDTFGRVFSIIDARNFQDLFIEWDKDGLGSHARGRSWRLTARTVRRSADKAKGKSPIHMVSAWATANGVALGQVKTADHSNEITAIPKLLKMLEIKGCIVTIDAMGCQKKIARQVVKQGADYVLAVKKNQPQLWDDIVGAFEYGERTRFATMDHDVFETVNKGHGRVERRRCWATSAPSVVEHANDRGEWANMNSVAMIESTRWADGKTTVHRRYFITSLPARADRILGAVREHWGVEKRPSLDAGRVVRGGTGGMIRIGTRRGEHVDAPTAGAESGEGGEVAENRDGGEAEAGGLGLGVSPNDTPTSAIRCDCPASGIPYTRWH